MAMPDKAETRPFLLASVELPPMPVVELIKVVRALALVVLALADAEWAREEAAEAQALVAADLANQAEREGA